MGSNYKKIEYESEGAYGSVEKHWLYFKSSRSNDYVTVYDDEFDPIFSYCDSGDFDMGKALVVACTNWNDERMENLTIEEIQKLK